MENQIEIYQGSDGQTQLEVRFEQETVWLTNNQLVELFDSSKANVSEHIKHIFQSKELEESIQSHLRSHWFDYSHDN